jgi:hypothetical protein
MLVNEREYLKDCLYDIFKEIIGEPELIFEHENGVRPIPPFFSLDFSNIRLLGTTPYSPPSLIEKGDKLVYATRQPVERYIILRGFGYTTEDTINSVHSALNLPSVISKLGRKGLVVSRTENVVESYSNYSEDEEVFFYLGFVLSYERIVSEETTYIESVSIEGNVDKRTLSIDIDISKEE